MYVYMKVWCILYLCLAGDENERIDFLKVVFGYFLLSSGFASWIVVTINNLALDACWRLSNNDNGLVGKLR